MSTDGGNGIKITTRDYIDQLRQDLNQRLDRLDGKIEGLTATIDRKADREQVIALDQRVTKLDMDGSHGLRTLALAHDKTEAATVQNARDVRDLQDINSSNESAGTFRRWVIGISFPAVFLISSTLTWLASHYQG